MSTSRGLLLLFPDGPDAVAWGRPRKGREPAFGRATAEEPLKVGGGERLVLLAPGEDVTLFAIDLPVRGGAQALAAARFAIEDDLAQPIEELEIALRPRNAGARREVAVVSRERLEAWTATLESLGAAAETVTPDYAALPVGPGAILVVEHNGRVLVRGEGLGFAADAALAPAVVGAVLAQRPDDAVTLRSDRAEALLPRALREGRRLEIVPAPTDAELLDLFAEGLAAGGEVDLAPRRRGGDAGLRFKDWRLAAGLGAAAAAAFVAMLTAETFSFRAHAAAAEADAARIVARAFPDAADAAEARAALRGGGAGAGFLTLSGLLAESVAEVPSMEIESLRFDETGDGLAVSVVFAAYEDVQALRAAIEARGGRLTEGASRMQNGRLMGELTVEQP
jgi:type II secretion system protein L